MKRLPVIPGRVTLLGDPVLRQQCDVVTPDIARGELQRLIETLSATMRAARGVGIAANQVGLNLRLIVLGDRARLPEWAAKDLYERQARQQVPEYHLLNPVLTPLKDAGQSTWYEGCLSVPDMTGIVPRWNRVAISGSDIDGQHIEFVASGWHARILQHELDHLDGTVYVDRALPRTLVSKSEYAKHWRHLEVEEVLVALGGDA